MTLQPTAPVFATRAFLRAWDDYMHRDALDEDWEDITDGYDTVQETEDLLHIESLVPHRLWTRNERTAT